MLVGHRPSFPYSHKVYDSPMVAKSLASRITRLQSSQVYNLSYPNPLRVSFLFFFSILLLYFITKLKTFQSIPHPTLTMLAKFIVSVLSLCGRAQKEEAELLPMVRCDFGCDVHVHGRSADECSKPREPEKVEVPEVSKEHGSFCKLKHEVSTLLSIRVQERCLSKAPLQAPELPHNRREFRRPRRAIGWEGRMGIPPQDLVSTHVKVSKLRFSNEHQVQKYDVHGPPCIVRRAEQFGGLRAGAFVWPDGSLSLGRVHPKARNRTNASDVWSTHGHMVSYT